MRGREARVALASRSAAARRAMPCELADALWQTGARVTLARSAMPLIPARHAGPALLGEPDRATPSRTSSQPAAIAVASQGRLEPTRLAANAGASDVRRASARPSVKRARACRLLFYSAKSAVL
jgi:hypothetical protein